MPRYLDSRRLRVQPAFQLYRVMKSDDFGFMTIQRGLQPVLGSAIPAQHIKEKAELETFGAVFGHIRACLPAPCPDPLEQARDAKPDGIVEVKHCVGAFEPWSEGASIGAIDDPAFGRGYRRQLFPDIVLAAFNPAGLPVELVHVKYWQAQFGPQLRSQCRLPRPAWPDDQDALHGSVVLYSAGRFNQRKQS